MFGMLKNLTKAVVAVAVVPVDIAADAMTLGGSLTDQAQPYTVQRLKQASKALGAALAPERD